MSNLESVPRANPLRWLAVLPGAAVAWIIAYWFVRAGPSGFIVPGSILDILDEIFAHGVAGAAFTYAGMQIAPEKENETGWVLFGFLFCAGALFTIWNVGLGDLFGAILAVAMVAGSYFAARDA